MSPREGEVRMENKNENLTDIEKAKAAGIMTNSIIPVVATVKITVLRKYLANGTAVNASA